LLGNSFESQFDLTRRVVLIQVDHFHLIRLTRGELSDRVIELIFEQIDALGGRGFKTIADALSRVGFAPFLNAVLAN